MPNKWPHPPITKAMLENTPREVWDEINEGNDRDWDSLERGLNQHFGIRLMNAEETPQDTPVFSPGTFRLLKKLWENPTYAFYASRKEDFSTKLEKPFRRLFVRVAGEVSDAIKKRMETEKGLFSKINKNDFGRGGAWDFYWGAFYPKGRRRIDSAQLYSEIDHELLYFGFAIGERGDEQRERFIRNCKRHGQELAARLSRQLPSGMRYGKDELRKPTLEEWLKNPEEFGISARVEVSKLEVLGASEAELCRRIVGTFEALFPLVLAASSGDWVTKMRGKFTDVTKPTAVLPPFAPLDETVLEPLEAGAALLAQSSGVRGGLGNASATRSERAKDIGNRAEELVFRELQRLKKRPKWISKEGLTPGWDIEYMEASGRVAVEVKGSIGDRFTSVELTANEWAAAQTERGNYHLYLVARCATRSAKREVIVDPASLVERGELDASPASWAIRRLKRSRRRDP
jgi:hypothetical protein